MEVAALARRLRAEGEARLREELGTPHLVDVTGAGWRAGAGPAAFPVGPGRRVAGVHTPCLTLGRAPRNDVVLEDAGVSRFHAYLLQENGGWSAFDADSHNGTWLNGRRVQAGMLGEGAALADHARLRLGTVELRFLLPDSFLAYLRAQAAGD